MSETIDKKLLQNVLEHRIESIQKVIKNLHEDDYEYKKVLGVRIDTMYHVIEILGNTNPWIRSMGDDKLEKLGLNIEDYE